MAARDHTTGRAAHRRPGRLDPNDEQTDVIIELDRGHMQTVETDEQIAARAVAGVGMAARSNTRRWLRPTLRSFGTGCQVAPDPEGLDVPHPAATLTPTATRKSPMPARSTSTMSSQ